MIRLAEVTYVNQQCGPTTWLCTACCIINTDWESESFAVPSYGRTQEEARANCEAKLAATMLELTGEA